MEIKIKGNVPVYGSAYAAGADLISIHDYWIEPGTMVLVNTGTIVDFPEGVYGEVYPRSSVVNKRGLFMNNSVGVIDTDYRGNILVPFRNIGTEVQHISVGERIAQIIFKQCLPQVEFLQVEEVSETVRGVGGFGSTGKF